MTTLLEARGLEKRYGTLKALSHADIDLHAGQIHGLIGPNGSGKSTLLKCLAGAVIPTAGTVRIDGRDVTREPASLRARAGLSMKFQITAVFPELSVYDNLLLAFQGADRGWRLAFSLSRERHHEQIILLLQQFGLGQRRDELAGLLPHGQQQWLEIAMALARRPRVLLLDEPTAGMSPQERRATGELLRSLAAGCALVIVEHDLEFVREICDALTVLDQGQVVACGSASEVQASPRVKEVYLQHG
jgi:branched-chain amino acid transport system ATP-binding protein